MMGEINKLTEGSNGVLAEADHERTVQLLFSGSSEPVITKPPVGAWTPVVSDAAALGQR
jgi:NitT/TauT family transport system substrate-binding protein